MPWNWELPGWPRFQYDTSLVAQQERQFLLRVGSACACLKNMGKEDYQRCVVEILSEEGLESAKIEGEVLDRESLQSSIKRHFGLQAPQQSERKESRMAALLYDVYTSFDQALTHEMLWKWHQLLFDGGWYRSHVEPMQIVSRRHGAPKVFFEAPSSVRVLDEIAAFNDWFNATEVAEPLLGRAAIAHLYFESIHPFEDGNGRIGRALVEKVLSQGVKQPVLIAVSRVLERRRKEYYAALERCNQTLEVDHWVVFFADAVLEAQEEALQLVYFLVEKSRMLAMLAGQLNARQEKVLLKMFAEGPAGFKGGLSADNYIAITKASRATATRDLVDLVQKGALIKTGELRHTRYWLAIDKT